MPLFPNFTQLVFPSKKQMSIALRKITSAWYDCTRQFSYITYTKQSFYIIMDEMNVCREKKKEEGGKDEEEKEEMDHFLILCLALNYIFFQHLLSNSIFHILLYFIAFDFERRILLMMGKNKSS